MTEHRPFKSSAVWRAVVAVAMTLLAFLATTNAASASGTDFTAQARTLGLTDTQSATLQARANSYLSKMGGTQVAVNKIRLNAGATVLLALPGEKYARDIDGQAGNAAYVCGYGHMCAYKYTYYTGDVIDMYACRDHYIPWITVGSWDNNQTTGTVAWFKDSNGSVGWQSPGAHSWDAEAPWDWVLNVNNCR